MNGPSGPIVVGVDGSDASSDALVWALDQARATGARVTLVHVIDQNTPVWLDPAADSPREARDLSLRAKAMEVLSHVRSTIAPGFDDIPVDDLVRIGDPRQVLVELSSQASMLVLGSRGRGPIETLLLGSTSVALVRHALCPLVVHRPARHDSVRDGIAVGVDASLDSLVVLDFAFRQATLRGEPLSIVHARHFPAAEESDDPFVEPPWSGDGAGMKDKIAELSQRYPDVKVETVVHRGMPETLLLELADHAALLVVGIHRRDLAAQFTFGSMAVWLVERATCPVAAVPLLDA